VSAESNGFRAALREAAAAGGRGYRAAFVLALVALAAGFVAGGASMVRSSGGPAGLLLDPRGLGDQLFEQDRFAEAAAEYRAAFAIDPWDGHTARRLGGALGKLGDWAGAAEVYREVVSRRPDDLSLRNRLGVAQYSAGDLGAAIETFDSILARAPRDLVALLGRGNAQLARGRLEMALADYRLALEVDSMSADAHNGVGASLGAMRDFDGSIEHFERALELEPGRAEVSDNLQRARAMRDRRRAREVAP
jgi:tetratricopeptide (TPR) repeat protein